MKRIFFSLIIVLIAILNFRIHKEIFNNLNFEKKNYIIVPNDMFFNIFIPDFLKPITSDFLWVKLTSRIDLNKRDKNTGKSLYEFMNLITDLDPYFYLPYLLGGSFLTSKNGYNMFSEGMEILKKGIKYLPEKWKLVFLAGYFNYFEHNKKVKGEKYFKMCLNLSTTPYKIKKLILIFLLKNISEKERILKIKKLFNEIKDEKLKKFLKEIYLDILKS